MELTGLAGRTAVVTGAGGRSGIGFGIANWLGLAGCRVIIIGSARHRGSDPSSPEGFHQVIADLTATGASVTGHAADLADPSEVEALWQEINAEHGVVSILVNNAGAARGLDRKPIAEVSFSEWTRVTRTNLDMTFLMSRGFVRNLKDSGSSGAIVNISSTSGRLFPATLGAYASSKSGIQALTKVMARELGPSGVRVNAVCPGYVVTDRMTGFEATDAGKAFIAATPLGRAGTVQDIVPIVGFLCSDQSAWVTGQCLNADGGYVIEP